MNGQHQFGSPARPGVHDSVTITSGALHNQTLRQTTTRASSDDRSQDVQVDAEADASLKVWTCQCDTVTDDHLESFTLFQQHVREGLRNLKTQDVRYDYIEALMIHWKGGDVPEVAQQAQALGVLFEAPPFNFTVTPHEIDYRALSQRDIDNGFSDLLTAVETRFRVRDEAISNLLIVYYGGHGDVKGQDRVWTPKKSSTKNLIWSRYQNRMYNLDCDIVYLFDCCCSLAMVETPSEMSQHRQRCEILCSGGLKEQSGALSKTMFTRALKEYLEQKRDRINAGKDAIGGMTFESIRVAMTKQEVRDKLTAEPRWKPVAPNPVFRGRITMAKKGLETSAPANQSAQGDADSGYHSLVESRSRLSDARVLIKIRLRNPAEGLSSDDWLKWFEQRPHNVGHIDIAVLRKMEWVGLFESDSSLALIAVPLWLWQNMQHDPACESLGIVRSENLFRRPPVATGPKAKAVNPGGPIPMHSRLPNNFPSRIDFHNSVNDALLDRPTAGPARNTATRRNPPKSRTDIAFSSYLRETEKLIPDGRLDQIRRRDQRQMPAQMIAV